MKKIVALTVCFLGIQAAFSQFATPEMERNFTKEEINDLETITSFFVEQISEGKSKDINDLE